MPRKTPKPNAEFGVIHVSMRKADIARLERVATRRHRTTNIQGRAFILRALDRLDAKEAKRAKTPTAA